MKLVTGNRLETGDVLWWAGDRWSASIADAAPLEPADADAVMAREKPAERVVDIAAVDAAPGPDGAGGSTAASGGWRPLHIRERIRGFGPTVRPDLATGKGYA